MASGGSGKGLVLALDDPDQSLENGSIVARDLTSLFRKTDDSNDQDQAQCHQSTRVQHFIQAHHVRLAPLPTAQPARLRVTLTTHILLLHDLIALALLHVQVAQNIILVLQNVRDKLKPAVIQFVLPNPLEG